MSLKNRGDLTKKVRSVLEPVETGREFDVREVRAALDPVVDFSNVPRPNSSISDVLRRLTGRLLEVVQPGSGTTPTIFRKL